MMKDTSGPAFPFTEKDGGGNHFHSYMGMTLRDYAAIEALHGMLAHPTRYKPRSGASANWHEAISEEAYQIADAMIAERSKP